MPFWNKLIIHTKPIIHFLALNLSVDCDNNSTSSTTCILIQLAYAVNPQTLHQKYSLILMTSAHPRGQRIYIKINKERSHF